MSIAPRFDLYAPIHKALRLFMMDTLQRLGRLDLDDAEGLHAGLAQLDDLLTAATRHLAHENDIVHPFLDARSPGLSARIAADHAEHLEAIAALRAELATLRAAPSAAHAHRLYRHLATFVAENFEHMEIEETRHNQALWAHHDDAALQALEGRILAGIGPQEMGVWLRWLIPALSPAERVALIGSMPPPVQGAVLDSARPLLDDAAWAKLCRAHGREAVPGLATA